VTRRYLGIDVGGTSCKLAVLEVDGDRHELLATAMVPTGPGGPDEVLDRLAAEGTRLATEHGPVAAAGAGVPGLFDEDSGRTVFLPNLPAAWNGREFGRRWPAASASRPCSSTTPGPSPSPRAAWARPPAARPWSA
jgi:predicted NBD/HSP70 family sugar kinase